MPHPLRFLFGYVRHRIPRSDAGALAELCRVRGFVYRDLVFFEEYVTFETSSAVSKKLIRECASTGVDIRVEGRYGPSSLLARYRRRYGAMLGLLIFLFISIASGQLLWDIRIDGNTKLDDGEVRDVLEECGMRVGSLIGGLDTAVIENRVLIASDEISWISINMVGCVAEVEIREAVPTPLESDLAAADLVAERGGVIELFENTRGNVAVSIGDRVEEGDLLVGGLYTDEQGECTRYTVAHGRVLARTERTFDVDIPLNYEKKVYTGEIKQEKYFIFFEKEIKFFGNCGNLDTTCDTIDTVEYFELFGGVRLPFGVRTVRYLEYGTEQASRDAESALELALYRLRCLMDSEVPEGMLLKKRIQTRLTDSSYELDCQAEYIEDIAITKEIEIDGIP